jgi:hypothetical protein
MKINKKALELIDKGLSSKTVSKLTESQIDTLHKKLFVEQTMVSKTDSTTISKLKSEKKPFQVYEKELEEEDDFDLDADQAYTGQQGSHDEDQPADDGMDDDTSPQNHDSKMIGMSEEKEDGPNAWAICHTQVGPKKSRKWERCVREVKKQLKEGKNPVSLFLESQIEKIVEKHIPPRITKGDLLKIISESEPAVAPTKPTTKPGTKPTTRPNKPAHPGKNPNPGEHPAPKAKKSETKEQQTAPEPTTKPAPTKPGTRPDTRPRPAHPGKNPNPGENPAPKAKKVSAEDAKDKVIDVIMNLLEK